ncbi:MAG: hypothetical protein U0263_06860 [Polyangiaceae bacterium]
MSRSKRTEVDLKKIAAEMRKAMTGPALNQVYRYAMEAGYLCALADGEADDDEKKAIVEALHDLSSGLVVEWEVDAMMDECNEAIGSEGHAGRCDSVGKKLKELGHAETGLLIGAYTALATAGLDKKEAGMLEKIGSAAGIPKTQVTNLVKQAKNALG